MNNQQPPAEEQVTPQMAQQVAPDVVSDHGQQQLSQKIAQAHQAKQHLDAIFEAIANHVGAHESYSRVKDQDTATKKIVTKRMEGRDYGLDDLNDLAGFRIIIKSNSQIPKVLNAIDKLDKMGVIDVKKKEKVKEGTYSATHIDGAFNGTKFELQVMSPSQEAESLVNHSIRSVAGQEPGGALEQLRDKQAQVANALPDDKARVASGAVRQAMQMTQNQPLPPQLTASILNQAQQSQGVSQ